MTTSRRRPARELAPRLLLVGVSVFWFSETIADPDLWGHLKFGRDILCAGSVLRVDGYSYRTSGETWFNHEWLAEAIFAGLFDVAGTVGLIGFKLLAALLIVGLSFAHLGRQGLGPYPAVVLLAIAGIPFHLGLATVRPQIFTSLLFLAELLLLERAAASRTAGAWLLPLLFAAWANLHGGFLAGIGVLAIWIATRAVERIRDGREPTARRLAAVIPLGLLGAACAASTLLNPYGASLIAFLLRTATGPRPEITEWAPMGLTSLPGLLDLALLAVGIAGLIGSRRPRRPSAVALFSATALLPMASARHYPLFAIATIVLAGEHIADAWDRFRPEGLSRPGPDRWLAPLVSVAGLALIVAAVPRMGCIRVEPLYFPFPARAVALLQRSGIRGNLAVPFDWGEYAIWHLGPALKVSIDGRRETVYSDRSYRQSLDLEHGTGAWDALLKTPPRTDLVLAPDGSPMFNLLARAAGWKPLYQDRCCAIFFREGLPDLDRLLRTPVPQLPENGRGLCFPAPGTTGRSAPVRGNRGVDGAGGPG